MTGLRPRAKLVAIGYNTAGTGLTRVMNSVMRRLAAWHEVHFLGIGYSGEIVRDRGLTIYNTNPKGGDVFAAFQARRLIEEIEPSLVFIMHDLWMFDYYLRLLEPYRDRVKIVAYIPLDGRIRNEDDAAPLANLDRLFVYTRFARAEFEGAFDRLAQKHPGRRFPAVHVIPHGIKRNRFFAFSELKRASFASEGRAGAKRKVFDDRPPAEDSFVVLNASRPDRRKRLDLTVRGFARFAAGKPPFVKLCLHHAVSDHESERQLASLIGECGIGDRVLVNPLGSAVVDDAELNLLYNACDVGINTSMGEGWGLVSFEHGAAGAAQIVPDHTACAELWSGRAELFQSAWWFIAAFSWLVMAVVSADGVATALESLYRYPARRRDLARAAVAGARNPAYSWDEIARQFDDLIVTLTTY